MPVVAKRLDGSIKMLLGTELGLGPGCIVLDGDPAPPHPPKMGGVEPPIFGPRLFWPNGNQYQQLLST